MDEITPIATRARRTRAWLPMRLEDGTRAPWLAPIELLEACYPDGIWNPGVWRVLSAARV